MKDLKHAQQGHCFDYYQSPLVALESSEINEDVRTEVPMEVFEVGTKQANKCGWEFH